MTLEYPFFLVNFKSTAETVGADGLAFAETIDRVAEATGTRFAVAPQPTDLRLVAERTDLPIVAQSAVRREDAPLGAVTLEAVAAAGADAVFLNHPQNRAAFGDVPRLLERCRELGLESICAVESREQARAALAYDPGPDCLLFERPDDIASEEGLVRTDPDRLEAFVEAVAAADVGEDVAEDEDRDENASEHPGTRVFVGGGIRTAEDVERAFARGVDATGAATAALAADDREAWLRSIADAVPRSS